MLNAGKGAPTSPPSSASADISIGIERIATPTVLSPASASGPSGSRSASINDLFASLGAAQTTSAPPNASPGAASPSRDASPAPTVAPPSGAMDLLGLLKKAQSRAAKRYIIDTRTLKMMGFADSAELLQLHPLLRILSLTYLLPLRHPAGRSLQLHTPLPHLLLLLLTARRTLLLLPMRHPRQSPKQRIHSRTIMKSRWKR